MGKSGVLTDVIFSRTRIKCFNNINVLSCRVRSAPGKPGKFGLLLKIHGKPGKTREIFEILHLLRETQGKCF